MDTAWTVLYQLAMFNIYQYGIMTNHLFVCSGLTKQCGFLKSLVPSQQSQVSLALAIPGTGLRRLMWRSGTKLQGYDDIMIFFDISPCKSSSSKSAKLVPQSFFSNQILSTHLLCQFFDNEFVQLTAGSIISEDPVVSFKRIQRIPGQV